MITRPIIPSIATIAGLLAAGLVGAAAGAGADEPWQQVSETGRRAISPAIAAGPDGSINVIWLDKGLTADRPPPKPRKPGEHSHRSVTDLYFARSDDGGQSWRKPIRVNPDPGSVWGFAVSRPVIAVAKNGTIHVFYPANDRSPVTDLDVIAAHYTRSTDGGRSFEQPRKINRPSPTDQRKILKEGLGASHSFGTMGLAPDGSVYAFWLDARDMKALQDGSYVYGTVSRDDGETFSEDFLILEGEACPCCQLTTAFDDETVFVGYRKIYADGRDSTVAQSNDGGKSFDRKTRLPFAHWDIAACPLKPTVIGIDEQKVYAAAYTGGEDPAGVYFTRSNDGGKTFAGRLPIHPEAPYSDAPQITVSPVGTIGLVWHAKTGGPRRLFSSESRDQGENFSAPIELMTPAGNSAYPATALAADGTTWVTWQQAGEEVFVTKILARSGAAARR